MLCALNLTVFVLGCSVTFRGPLFHGNFGVVDPGRVLSVREPYGNLRELIRREHLATVLNLRGGFERRSLV